MPERDAAAPHGADEAAAPGGAYDAVVVGAGPAGLNAALVLGRARRSVLLCDDGAPRNAAALEMHGFITRDGSSPRRLADDARAELARYPAVTFARGVEDIRAHGPSGELGARFTATLRDGRVARARRVMLATGVVDELPAIEGLQERWGRSVFVCPHCDGWEFREHRIAAYGAPNAVVELAQELIRWSRDLVLLGVDECALAERNAVWVAAAGVRCIAGRPRALRGEGAMVRAVELEDGTQVPCDVLFLSTALVQRSVLAARLGCAFRPGGALALDACRRTTVPGVYAAGDMAARVHQVVVAAASGVEAAMALAGDLAEEEAAALIARGRALLR